MSWLDNIIKISLLAFVLFFPLTKNQEKYLFEVSIIIPVHNNFYYTYNCVTSILNADLPITHEIIIINDMSTDETELLKEKYFKNVTNLVIYNNKKKNNIQF